MIHDENDEIKWKKNTDEWLPHVKNDVLCTACSCQDIVKLCKK